MSLPVYRWDRKRTGNSLQRMVLLLDLVRDSPDPLSHILVGHHSHTFWTGPGSGHHNRHCNRTSYTMVSNYMLVLEHIQFVRLRDIHVIPRLGQGTQYRLDSHMFGHEFVVQGHIRNHNQTSHTTHQYRTLLFYIFNKLSK